MASLVAAFGAAAVALSTPAAAQLPNGVERYTVAVPQVVLDRIKQRVVDYKWPTTTPSPDWRYGVEAGYLHRLAEYWVTRYDWRAEEREINARGLYRVSIEGDRVAFVWEHGSGHSHPPLLILPGLPYSFASYLPIVDQPCSSTFGTGASSNTAATLSCSPTQASGASWYATNVVRRCSGWKMPFAHSGQSASICARTLGHPPDRPADKLATAGVRGQGAVTSDRAKTRASARTTVAGGQRSWP